MSSIANEKLPHPFGAEVNLLIWQTFHYFKYFLCLNEGEHFLKSANISKLIGNLQFREILLISEINITSESEKMIVQGPKTCASCHTQT